MILEEADTGDEGEVGGGEGRRARDAGLAVDEERAALLGARPLRGAPFPRAGRGVAPAVVSARCSVSPCSSSSSTSIPNDGARAGRRFECSSSDAEPPSPKAGSAMVPSESTRTMDEKLSSL